MLQCNLLALFPFSAPLFFLASIYSTHLLIGDVLTAAWRLALAWLLWSPPAADWIDALLCCPFHNTYLPVLLMKCSNLFRSLVTVQYFDLFELQKLSLNCACYLVIKVEVIYSCFYLILPSVWFKEQNGRKLKLAGMLQEKL